MTPDYAKMPDGELSAAVAEQVAGCSEIISLDGNPYKLAGTFPDGHRGFIPPYATSADAVIPLLETWLRIAQIRRPEGNFEWYGGRHKYTSQPYVELAGLIGGNIRYYAPTFPRAACLALLAALPPAAR